MQKFLIVKAGGTFADYAAERGDFENWAALGMSLEDGRWVSVDVQNGEPLPDPPTTSAP